MSQQIDERSEELWRRVVENHKAFSLSLMEFFSEGIDRVAILRRALRVGERATALYVAPHMSAHELLQLFEEWVFLASFSHGGIQRVREIILSLPRDWVLGNVEAVAEPLLRDGTDDEYRRLLELYLDLDHDLTSKLARRALSNADEDIREAGRDFLQLLNVEPEHGDS